MESKLIILNSIRLLIYISTRNFNNTTLIVKLVIPSGIVDVHELAITQHNILAILISFNGLLHFNPSGRRHDEVITTVGIHLFKQLQGLTILPKSQSHLATLVGNSDMLKMTLIT